MSASVPCAKRNTSGFCSVEISGTRPVPSISSCHQRISRSCCAGVASFSHSAYCATELAASLPANRCALRNWFTVSKATSSGPSPKGVKLRGFIRMYINWPSRRSTAADSSCPGITCAYRGVSGSPSHRALIRIEAPSTAHIIAGRSGSPVGSISIAPNPPVSASSMACSIRVRKLSTAFGSSSIRRNARSLLSVNARSCWRNPRRTLTCQSMAAIRSLMTLIARRTTGVSANRRRFIGVALGSSRPGN